MNLIPTLDKRPLPNDWANYKWDGKLWKKQTGVGFVNGQDGIICLDFDKPEYFYEHEKWIMDNFSVNQTPKGFHAYVIPEEPLHGNVEYVTFGEVRVRNSHNVFPYDLPFSKNYRHINKFNPKKISNQELKNFLTPYLKPKELKPTTNLRDTFEGHEDMALGGILSLMPTGWGQNHNSLLKLARMATRGQNEALLMEEWLLLNRFKRHSDDAYRAEFANILQYVNKDLCKGNLTSVFNKLWDESVPQVGMFKSRQKRIDWVIEGLMKELGKNGKFFLSTRFREDDNIIENRLDHKEVSRAIERLIKNGKVIRVSEAWKWTPTKKKVHSAEYIWIGE